MSLETAAPAGGEAVPVVEIPAAKFEPGGEGPLSVREAARSFTDWRRKQEAASAEPIKQETAPEPATPAQESEAAQAADDATPPETEATGEAQADDPAQQPPLDPPRSWSKEKSAIWNTLDRAAQEYLLEHDREVSKGVRNAQNEAAEKLKGLTAKEQEVEQARAQYEAALPLLLQNLQQIQQGEFSDIKTMADVQKMAADDWPRYVRWDAQQKQIAATYQEVQAAQQRQAQEQSSKFAEYAKEQDKLFADQVPEFADKEKAASLQSKAVELLKSVGYSEDELARLWNSSKEFRSAGMQRIILDAVRFHDAQQAVKKAQPRQLPPVQRPGVAQPATAGIDQQIKALEKQLANETKVSRQLELGAKLTGLRRQANAR